MKIVKSNLKKETTMKKIVKKIRAAKKKKIKLLCKSWEDSYFSVVVAQVKDEN
jgi:hypothetical protein